MPAESVTIASLLKWLWVGVIVPAFMFLFRRQDKLKEEVFTKVETIAHVENSLAPVFVEIEQSKEARKENTKAVRELTNLITNLRIDLASRDSSHRTRSTDE